MRLLNDFFQITNFTASPSGFAATITLNRNHVVYQGHFPGFPVTPGVVQLQIVHELLEYHFNQRIKLAEMPQCKFLHILNPEETPRLTVKVEFQLSAENYQVNAQGDADNRVIFRLQASYRPEV